MTALSLHKLRRLILKMKNNITFENAMKRLDEIISQLNAGEIPLAEALELYGESAKLLAFCKQSLNEAQLTVEEIFPEKIGEEDVSENS